MAVQGTIKKFSTGTTITGAWTEIAEVLSFTMGEIKRDVVVYTTNASNGVRQAIPGNIEFSEMEINLVANTAAMALQSGVANKTVTFYQIILADDSEFAFEGFITSFKVDSVDMDGADVLSVTVKIKPTGTVTVTDPA